jgi:hypothetical protein
MNKAFLEFLGIKEFLISVISLKYMPLYSIAIMILMNGRGFNICIQTVSKAMIYMKFWMLTSPH